MRLRNAKLVEGTNLIRPLDPTKEWAIGSFVHSPDGKTNVEHRGADPTRSLPLSKCGNLWFGAESRPNGLNDLTVVVVVCREATIYVVATREEYLVLTSKVGGPNGEEAFCIINCEAAPNPAWLAFRDVQSVAESLGCLLVEKPLQPGQPPRRLLIRHP